MIVLSALLALAAAPPAPPPAAPPAPPVLIAAPAADPAAMAEAETLVGIMKVDRAMQTALDRTIEAMRSGAMLSAQLDQNPAIHMRRAQNPQAWDAAIARIGAAQADAAAKALGDLPPQVHIRAVQVYASLFTAADLRGLIAFYRTPIGMKLLAQGEAIALNTQGWLQQAIAQRLSKAMPPVQAQVRQELAPLLAPPGK